VPHYTSDKRTIKERREILMNEIKSTATEKPGGIISARLLIAAAIVGAAVLAGALIGPKYPACLGD